MRANRTRAGTAFYNPNYHLTAFSLQNPTVQWAIEKGAYNGALCWACFRYKRGTWQANHCRPCGGTGMDPGDALCAKDFGSPEDLAIAMQLDPSIARQRATYHWQAGGLR